MIIETEKSNTSICVILITLFICRGCGKVTQYFPTCSPTDRGAPRAGQALVQPRAKAQRFKVEAVSRLARLPGSSATRAPERQLFEAFGQLPEERFAIGFVLGKCLTEQKQNKNKPLQLADECSRKRAVKRASYTPGCIRRLVVPM